MHNRRFAPTWTGTSRLLVVALALVALAAVAPADAAFSPANEGAGPWTLLPGDTLVAPASGRAFADGKVWTARLDRAALNDLLATAPLEQAPGSGKVRVAASATILALPMPGGSFARFSIVETPVLAPQLAAQFPAIRTYHGHGVDDRSASARIDVTPLGFHAQVLSAAGTAYIDPIAPDDLDTYVVFDKRDYRRGDLPRFECRFADPGTPLEHKAGRRLSPDFGTERRTYRLAVAATGEYTAAFGGTAGAALAGITTTINRINGILEREVAVRFQLVAGESAILYTNPATDPYDNDDPDLLLDQNQANLDLVIGSANYDIGHVFTTDGGGLASLGSVCNASRKAQGTSGSSSPSGDAFDVDIAAHELGHSLGAGHTFNSQSSGCGGGNRSASSAFEPGSGSTIMAYTGLCSPEDLQDSGDDYYHSRSLDQIIAFISGAGDSCAARTTTGNTPPSVSGDPVARTIPRGTPFALDVISTGDADGDTLTYCWEERDLGTVSPPLTDDGSRPLFRSFKPTTIHRRVFPRLDDLLDGTTSIGESLPTTTRTMTFRVVARDNHFGSGGTAVSDVTVNVRAEAGPFVVTQPAGGVTRTGGAASLVTWNVAGTDAPPVSTSSVSIHYSMDGGLTFPGAPLLVTANDGSAMVTIPCGATTSGRIRVSAVGSVYFNVSPGDFTVVNGGSCPAPQPVERFRLYHDGTKEHLYTTDENEYDVLATRGWIQEGISHRLLTPAGTFNGVATRPLFRLYHPGILQHHWTIDANERDVLRTERGWTYEGIDGNLLPAQALGSVPLYRLALPAPPLHLWTADLNEYQTLPSRGWIQEGIAGYVLP